MLFGRIPVYLLEFWAAKRLYPEFGGQIIVPVKGQGPEAKKAKAQKQKGHGPEVKKAKAQK